MSVDLVAQVEVARAEFRRRRREALAPPPLVTVDEWADTRRVLGREESRIAGPYRTSAVEVCRGPMRAVTEPGVREITVLSSAQLMKTTTILNTLGYYIDYDPATILIYQPTDKEAADFASDKLNPMLRNTPSLTAAFGGRRALSTKSSDNQRDKKRFRGGSYSLLNAGSVGNLGSRSVRVVMLDEIDKYAAIKAGDQVSLARRRTEVYEDSKTIIKVSTPRETGTSRIEAEWRLSDQRRPYVACPHCEHEDHLEWEHVSWSKDDGGRGIASTAAIFCKLCGAGWSEIERYKIMTTKGAISWRQTRPFVCCGKSQDPQETRSWVDDGWVHRATCTECGALAVSNRHAGFRAGGVYSPFRPLSSVVQDWLDVQGDRAKIRQFVNEVLARTFDADDDISSLDIEPEHLAARGEPRWSELPAAAKILTAGVDVQPQGRNETGRLECEIVAWADGEESWSVDYHVIPGDPSTAEPWLVLDEILQRPVRREDGADLYVQATCIDTGGAQSDTLAFTRPRESRRVWATKGVNESAGTRRAIWPKAPTTVGGGARLYTIGTQAAKDKVGEMLQRTQPGPLYMHVPSDRGANWYQQITAERRVVVHVSGQARTQWRPRYNGIRNEALDCRVYAYAALEGYRHQAASSRSLARIAPARSIDVAPDVEVAEGIETSIAVERAAVTQAAATVTARPVAKRRGGGGGGGFGKGGFGRGGGFGRFKPQR